MMSTIVALNFPSYLSIASFESEEATSLQFMRKASITLDVNYSTLDFTSYAADALVDMF